MRYSVLVLEEENVEMEDLVMRSVCLCLYRCSLAGVDDVVAVVEDEDVEVDAGHCSCCFGYVSCFAEHLVVAAGVSMVSSDSGIGFDAVAEVVHSEVAALVHFSLAEQCLEVE